jgi:hypothetical protein
MFFLNAAKFAIELIPNLPIRLPAVPELIEFKVVFVSVHAFPEA